MGTLIDLDQRREEARMERAAFADEALAIAGRLVAVERALPVRSDLLRSLAHELGEKAVLSRAEVDHLLGGHAA